MKFKIEKETGTISVSTNCLGTNRNKTAVMISFNVGSGNNYRFVDYFMNKEDVKELINELQDKLNEI
jgi:hypothetical protein